MTAKIQIRRDLAANWTSVNPILASGELGYETDTDKLKIGDGVASWTSLPYFEPVGSHTHILADITDAGTAAALNVATSGDAASGEVVKGDDTRLTDSRSPTAHTHTKSDITDFSDGDYAPTVHTHTKSDITDFSEGDYAPAVHTHTKSDITDFSDGDYAAAVHTHTKSDIIDFNDADYAAASHTHTKSDITDFNEGDYAPAVHTHTKSDITDFSDGDYAPTVHTHTKSDITDFSDGDYAPASHTHTKSDITDFSDGDYAPASHTHTKSDITDFSDGDYAPASHTHTLSEVTDAGTSAALNVAASGDAAAGEVVKGDDSRLTDSRTPTAHTHVVADITDFDPADKANTVHTHVLADVTNAGTAAALNVAASGNAAAGEVVKGNDSRLTDARTPTAHTHPQSDIVNLTTDLAAKADLVAGKVPTSQIPDIAISEFLGNAADQTAQVALTGEVGDWCIRTDQSKTYIITANDGSTFSDWTEIATPAAPVSSVNGLTGTVVLGPSDVGAAAASHTHTKSDITDFSDADYAAASHTHTKSDITDFSDADYAAAVHTHTKSDITDFSDADYAAAVHTHTKSDITDFSDADYASAVHTHTKSDITDFSDADYAAAVHTHVLSDVTDAGTAAALNVPATGNAAIGEVVKGDDSRLTDSRTPTAHTHVKADITDFSDADYAAAVHTHTKSDITDFNDGDYAAAVHTHTKSDIIDFNDADYAAASHTHTLSEVTDAGTAAALNVAASGDAAVGEVVKGNDSRLTDARTPTSHTHAIADVTNLQTTLDGKASTATSISAGTGLTGGGTLAASRTLSANFGTAAGTICQGNDARLSDARTPTAHTHDIQDVNLLESNLDFLDGQLATKVPNSRTISTTGGLTGGGDLSANRTLSINASDGLLVDSGALSVQANAGRAGHVSANGIGVVPNTGTGLLVDDFAGPGDPSFPAGRLSLVVGSGLEFGNLPAGASTSPLKAKAQLFRDAYTINVANFASSVSGYWLLDMNAPAARTLTEWAIICDTGSVTLGFLRNGSSVGMPIYTGTSAGSGGNWSGASLSAGDSLSVYVFATSGSPTDFAVQLNFTQLTEVQ